MIKIGGRVGAILGSERETVSFLGYGVYEGEFIPKEAVGVMARLLKKSRRTNPRIKLDSGKVVYECECWWGSEKEIQEKLKGYHEIKNVDIDEVRNDFIKTQEVRSKEKKNE